MLEMLLLSRLMVRTRKSSYGLLTNTTSVTERAWDSTQQPYMIVEEIAATAAADTALAVARVADEAETAAVRRAALV